MKLNLPSASFCTDSIRLPSPSYSSNVNSPSFSARPVSSFVPLNVMSPFASYVFTNSIATGYVTSVASVPSPLSVTFTFTVKERVSYVMPSFGFGSGTTSVTLYS